MARNTWGLNAQLLLLMKPVWQEILRKVKVEGHVQAVLSLLNHAFNSP